MPHLYLVDGSGYIFRAYHRLPPLTNKHGEPVGAVYGYTTMLWKLVTEVNAEDGPTHMAVILDGASTSFRNAMYEQYKAHRPEPPEDLKPQFAMVRDATRALSLPCIEDPELEADDIIACYTRAARAAGWTVTIVSSDKDLMQLIEPEGTGVELYDTMNNRRLGRDHVEEKFGVGPERLGDVLALMGDSVDNVPGVPGIGPKTAAQLITEFGDLDGVLANVDTIKKPKLKQSLIDHQDAARMSRELVKLVCDKPLPQPLEELALKGLPEEPLRAFLEHHGFRTLLGRLGVQTTDVGTSTDADAPPPVPFDLDAYECVTSLDRLDYWLARATAEGVVAVDTETDGLYACAARLIGFSLAVAPGEACYVPLTHGGRDLLADKPAQLDFGVALARLKPLLADPGVLKIGHNIKYSTLR